MSKTRVMRRRNRQVTDPQDIARILELSTVIFVALHDEPAPYVVPLFFGHEPGKLYVHSALMGTKIELLRSDPRIGFSTVAEARIVDGKDACDFTARAESVAGTGAARIVDDEKEKMHGLDLIMRHYAPNRSANDFRYRPETLSRTCVIAIDVEQMTAKRI